jgi:hypothetical protein
VARDGCCIGCSCPLVGRPEAVKYDNSQRRSPVPALATWWTQAGPRAGGVSGTGKELARRAEALGLHPIAWHPEVRLYDAEDGARLRGTLTSLP